jgi:hypothetical protein
MSESNERTAAIIGVGPGQGRDIALGVAATGVS